MIILLFIVLMIAALAFDALMLNVTTKIFKVNGANYKTALIICVLALIIFSIFNIILSIFGFAGINIILAIFFVLFIFHKLLQKYYQTSFKKNIAIYAVFTIITVIISLFIAIPARSFVTEPFYNDGKSMEPTYQDKDYLLINKFDKNYSRGDIIVFKNPKNTEQTFIKRVIGLPGEKVQLRDGSVYLYDAQNPSGYKLSEPYLAPNTETFGIDENIIELASNEYYLLGDNRPVSKDSRSIGAVSLEYFSGKIWFKGSHK